MHRINPQLMFMEYYSLSSYYAFADETIPFRHIKYLMNEHNVDKVLNRKNLTTKEMIFIIGRNIARPLNIVESPSFTDKILSIVTREYMKRTKSPYYDIAIELGFPADYKLRGHELRLFEKKISKKVKPRNLPEYICERTKYVDYNWIDVPIVSDRIFVDRRFRGDYYRFAIPSWDHGKNYSLIKVRVMINFHIVHTTLKNEIKSTLQVCFRYKIPQEILHMIIEFLIC